MSGFKVLVADDSPVYRKLVEHALAEDSCSVLFANSGHQAIELFEREHPDLVVTDWMMPDITGIAGRRASLAARRGTGYSPRLLWAQSLRPRRAPGPATDRVWGAGRLRRHVPEH